MTDATRFDLPQDQLPAAWFNIMPSIAQAGIQPLPPLHPGTHEPVTPDLLAPLFPEALILQRSRPSRGSTSRGRCWTCTACGDPRRCSARRVWSRRSRRPPASTTSTRASRRRAATSPTPRSPGPLQQGSGHEALATETGAGQWGLRPRDGLASRPRLPGLHGEGLLEQKPYRRIFMETFGAEVVPSPSPTTQAGKAILEADPDSTGSLGIAISEAIEVAATSGGAIEYSLGSVLNHVLCTNRDRARGEGADGDRRRPTGCRDRLRRRRIELRRPRLPVHGGPVVRRHPRRPVPRDRAGSLPDPHEGSLRLRLRRYG